MNNAITIPLRKARKRQIGLQTGEDSQRQAARDVIDRQIGLFTAALGSMATENERLKRELHETRARAARLAGKVVAVQEEERLRISRELHDEAGQALTALKFNLASIRASISDPEAMRSQLDELVELTNQTMEQIRRLAHDLRPCVLDRFPLDQVLDGMCCDFARRTGLEIRFSSNAGADLSDAARVSYYRFLQETLTNAAKHAGATRVDVQLMDGDGCTILSVSDDGAGFGVKTEGVGLTGLQERFELLGGCVDLVSSHGGGACIQASVPAEQGRR